MPAAGLPSGRWHVPDTDEVAMTIDSSRSSASVSLTLPDQTLSPPPPKNALSPVAITVTHRFGVAGTVPKSNRPLASTFAVNRRCSQWAVTCLLYTSDAADER